MNAPMTEPVAAGLAAKLHRGALGLWRLLGSFGLAVAVLLLLLVLTFVGTLEQQHDSIYNVQRKFFESIVLTIDVGFPLPMPGAYLLLSLLFVNLIVGGMIRIRKTSRLIGVMMIHAGMGLLLLGGMIEFQASTKGALALYEAEAYTDANRNGRHDVGEAFTDTNGDGRWTPGEVGEVYRSYFDWDLSVAQRHADGRVTEHIVPYERLEKVEPGKRARFTSAGLPVEIEVRGYSSHARIETVPTGAGYGVGGLAVHALPENIDKKEHNTPGMYVALKQGGERAECVILATQRWPAVLKMGDDSYLVDIRRRTWELPYKIRLNEFIHKQFPGTSMAAEFSSRITKIEDDVPEDRLITMNEPLRHRGFTLYQTSYDREVLPNRRVRMTSVFAVVKNPADKIPLIACIIIGLGLLVHFALKLFSFHQRERRRQGS